MPKIIQIVFRPIDYFLDRITMYRLVLYYLAGLLAIAGIFGGVGLLPYNPILLAFSAVYILAICWIVNSIFSRALKAPTNVESVYITALILTLIINPPQGFGDTGFFILASLAAIFANASKYIITIKKKHIFNPAAFGAAITALIFGLSASWWVGTSLMTSFVAIGGLFLIKKIKRFDLVLSFGVSALLVMLGYGLYKELDLIQNVQSIIFDTPILFFAFVMLTEPLTTPPARSFRIAYGALVGVLYAPFVHFFGIFSTPELSLLVGNAFSYIVSPKQKMMLVLVRRERVARDTYDFVFERNKRFDWKPGQYLEWTLPHSKPDNRGVRRYFTIAASPTENEIRIGVKFPQEPSSFKKALFVLLPGEVVVASQLSGSFTMPEDKTKKLVFIAGGIGVTPFRSMIKYLIDKNQWRDITIFYSNREVSDIAYKDIFDEANKKFGIETVYTLTDKEKIPSTWQGNIGLFDAESIKTKVTEHKNCIFYVSGPISLVNAFVDTLGKMDVPRKNIKTDYFPGYA